MTSNSYRKGYLFEIRVKKLLEKNGWTVFRQSKSSFPDLICLKATNNYCSLIDRECHRRTTEIQLVECKVDKSGITNDEKQKLKELADSIGTECYGVFAYRQGKKVRFKTIS